MEWTEYDALDALRRKRITVDKKVILMTKQPGIKMWGCVDYLVHIHKYRVVQEEPTWKR